jgi:hypothetical protein
MDTMEKVKSAVNYSRRSITISERRIPAAFFRPRSGLRVQGEFLREIVPFALPVDAKTILDFDEGTLTEELDDNQLDGVEHCFGATPVCAILPELIESGELRDKKGFQLFYTSPFVVLVCWSESFGEHVIYAWPYRRSLWKPGTRVFRPAVTD